MFFQSLFAVLIFAFVPLAIKFTAATPLTICFIRLFMAVIVLGFFWRKKIHFNSPLKSNKKLILLGIIFFLHWISYAYAVKLGGASIGVLGLSTYGIQLSLASALFLGHRIRPNEILGLVFSFIGILLIIPSWSFKDKATLGVFLAVFSSTCFALIPIIHKRSLEFNQETRIFSQFFGAFIAFLFFFPKMHWSLTHQDWGLLAFLGLFGTIMAHALWAKITIELTPVISGLIHYTITPMALIFSHFLLGESFTKTQMIGVIIIIISAVMTILSLGPEKKR